MISLDLHEDVHNAPDIRDLVLKYASINGKDSMNNLQKGIKRIDPRKPNQTEGSYNDSAKSDQPQDSFTYAESKK